MQGCCILARRMLRNALDRGATATVFRCWSWLARTQRLVWGMGLVAFLAQLVFGGGVIDADCADVQPKGVEPYAAGKEGGIWDREPYVGPSALWFGVVVGGSASWPVVNVNIAPHFKRMEQHTCKR